MSLEVIAIGPPRTGTSSLKAALITLGYGKCMHMDELFNQPELVDLWIELFETGTTDYDRLFSGYRSSTDFPGCLAYRELMARYPDAKFIINYREPGPWYDSMRATVDEFVPQTPEAKQVLLDRGREQPRFLGIARTLGLVEKYLLRQHYGGAFADRERTLKTYQTFFEEARETIPAQRRIEYNVSEGWGPLCDFLEVPEPTAPFPFKNKRADFISQIGGMITGGGKLQIK
ncbi:MAG: sulfotransferase family protein [Lewinella sp.]